MFSPICLNISAYCILGSIQRGTKRPRDDDPRAGSRTRTRSSTGKGFRSDIARAHNEDCTRQTTTAAAGTTVKQLLRIFFRNLSTAELEDALEDGNQELDRRHSVV